MKNTKVTFSGVTFDAKDVTSVYGSNNNENLSMVVLDNGAELIIPVPPDVIVEKLNDVLDSEGEE